MNEQINLESVCRAAHGYAGSVDYYKNSGRTTVNQKHDQECPGKQ